jgi:hypothetical protein
VAETHVVCALRDKRSELAGMVNRLEQELVERRASLTHLDATMRLFDPDLRPQEIRPRRLRSRNAWFRPGECLTTRELAERIMDAKAIPAADDRQRALIQKTILGSLNRAKETIEGAATAGVVRWRLN